MDEFRVERWDDFVGQDALKSRLSIHIKAAKMDVRTLEPVLLAGPTGFGKTSLATIIANELETEFEMVEMPLTDRALQNLVRSYQGVLLLDEIHRAPAKTQESLLPLLEFGWVQPARGPRIRSNNLVIVAATTEQDKVIKPLYDRFPIRPDFDPYTDDEMGQIVTGMAAKAGVRLDSTTALDLGRATGGTPRKARQFVLAARDLIVIDPERTTVTATEVLDLCRVDATGVSQQHKDYLAALAEAGGIAGLSTLRNLLRLSESVVRDLEILLIKQDLIRYTERGRELTNNGQAKIEGW